MKKIIQYLRILAIVLGALASLAGKHASAQTCTNAVTANLGNANSVTIDYYGDAFFHNGTPITCGQPAPSTSQFYGVGLPVELKSFTVSKENTVAKLSWTTTEEINASHFEILRSADAKNWNPIGQKDAKGESKSTITYSYTDSAPLSGTNYYRLKMIERDATFSCSRIQNVKFDSDRLGLYPNPVSDLLFLKDLTSNTPVDVSFHNAKGQVVFASGSISASGISVRNLPAGIYIVRIIEAGALHTHTQSCHLQITKLMEIEQM